MLLIAFKKLKYKFWKNGNTVIPSLGFTIGFALVLFFAVSSFGQQKSYLIVRDSILRSGNRTLVERLIKKLQNSKEDTNKIKTLDSLSFYASNNDSGILLGQSALALSQKLNFKYGEAQSLEYIGDNYEVKSEYNIALTNYFNAMKVNEIYNGDKAQLANIIMSIGTVYKAKGDYDSSLGMYRNSLRIFEDLHNQKGTADVNKYIGNIYELQGKYKESLEQYFKAKKIFEEIKDTLGLARVYQDIGVVCRDQQKLEKALEYYKMAYSNYLSKGNTDNIASMQNDIAILYNDQKVYDSALNYYNQAIDIFSSTGKNDKLASTLINIGQVYKNQNNYDKALEIYNKGLKISEQYNMPYLVAVGYGNIGELYLSLAKDNSKSNKTISGASSKSECLNKSIEFLNKSLKVSKEIGDREGIEATSEDLYEAYSLAGNYKGALENYLEFTAIKDSLNSFNDKAALATQEAKDKKEIQDKQIQINKLAVEKKNNLSIFLSVGIVVLIFIIGLVIRSNLNQRKSNIIITKEKKRSDELLLNILPSEVAEELKDKGSADAKFFENVTVLFTDFVGFTKVAEQMTPQQLVNELDACFKAFDNIMGKYNIEKIKTVGDAYLAVSGLPLGDPNHAEKVVSAAIEIKDFMTERKKLLGELTFEVRIGCHTGSVVAGIVGVKKFAYDIWGDTVNTAARMEQNSQPMKINISQNTYEQIKHRFICSFRGKIQAKNKGELSMYFVEGLLEGQIA